METDKGDVNLKRKKKGVKMRERNNKKRQNRRETHCRTPTGASQAVVRNDRVSRKREIGEKSESQVSLRQRMSGAREKELRRKERSERRACKDRQFHCKIWKGEEEKGDGAILECDRRRSWGRRKRGS